MIRVLITLRPVALAIYAIADISRTDESQIKVLPKWGWFLISIFVTIIGPIAWLIAGKNRNPKPPRGNRGNRGRGPKGPDDDPDFLIGL